VRQGAEGTLIGNEGAEDVVLDEMEEVVGGEGKGEGRGCYTLGCRG
jgi:hypothetical protein